MQQLNTHELNYLIWRYLCENSFCHSGYVLGQELKIDERHNLWKDRVADGALLQILMKGLEFMEMEAHLEDDARQNCKVPMSLLGKHTCSSTTPQTDDFMVIPKSKKHKRDDSSSLQNGNRHSSTPSNDETSEKRRRKDGLTPDFSPRTNGLTNGSSGIKEFSECDLVTLENQTPTAILSSWRPGSDSILATASADGIVNIWDVENEEVGSSPIIIKHGSILAQSKNSDVTALEWSPSGIYLATGTYEGRVCIWTKEGALRSNLILHRGPIMVIRWNIKGNTLLSTSCDGHVIAWDISSGDAKSRFEKREDPVVDIDWIDNQIFAAAGKGGSIEILRVGSEGVISKMEGHPKKEVNCLKCDPETGLIASCSDDSTARIWKPDQRHPLHTLFGHTGGVISLRWQPLTQNSSEMPPSRLLATCSLDSTVRIWNALDGSCLQTLQAHDLAVYTISFSSDGRKLASGGKDGLLAIWHIESGQIEARYDGEEEESGGQIVDLLWKNDRIAMSRSRRKCAVLKYR
ncbi:F-box-like/WD repeat-containing protein TBL1XR1 [Neolecta irregularis DAH-3]|uniref:F-box-like/WD repeat-containing protein TBL1XR1 n=1 Tax=Neolecta irregularis (strain DAH-3) TaxID=1198029 RepID=A0A1U7LTX8_NEOID|nr:F-box-like/WD repeat-containing protein TBL1XR1 [Neolecta irregularis DAH-3]|eukprot:OLL26033.1 F-box-like/WD repeat-containing protein TBL1XR1 [Neolecta irregularis DAH-3]